MTAMNALSVAVYQTADDVPEAHRFVGYFYWPNGEVANVVFRGAEPDALRSKIAAFATDQLNREASLSATVSARREASTAKLKATLLAKKSAASLAGAPQ